MGYELSKHEVGPAEEKMIKVVTQAKEQFNTKEVKRFLGFQNFVCR